MPLKKWDSIVRKKGNIRKLQKIMFILSIIFLISMSGILFVEKNYEQDTLEYINKMNEESIYISLEEVEYLKNISEYRKITYLLLVLSSLVLMILLKYMNNETKEHQKDVEDLVLIDEITGGYSKIAFQMVVEKVIRSNPAKTYSIVLLNVKNFKLINNKFGFIEGDNVLRYIYDEIKNNLNKEEFICRSEIDNFFICIKENNQEYIRDRLKKIESDVNKYREQDFVKYSIQFTYGIALIDDVNKDIRILMDYARFSCSNYKKNKEFKNYSKIVEDISKENKINSIFEESLNNGEFKVYLQPKINLTNNNCEGAEALVRWIRPKYGTIYPGEFIDLFEENENIIKLDTYIFEEVCKIIKSWIKLNKKLIPISVNLSKKHIRNNYFISDFVKIKNKYEIPDGVIEFEIIESIALDGEKMDLFIDAIDQFHKNGFKCSLDDFGFGYSSLAIFSKLDVDTIKLDRRFFVNLKNEKAKKL